ncbi:hypothetical protein CcaverHIS002_0100020 [Cutaneotrichosporon cavernicola]|nr:hypothetical protein CcaverHIS002_0100020 [Cutaneotrichosporon cavernicola]
MPTIAKYPQKQAYPGQTTTVAMRDISPYTEIQWLEATVSQLCPGLKSCTFAPSKQPHDTKRGELEFLTTDAADRALAILNTHPALADTGMSFCLPGDPSVRAYPELRTLFTRSLGHAQPRTCKCRRAYDELIVYGPIHYVTVCSTDEDVDYTRRGAIWHIMVQFFDPDVAAIVDHSLTSFLGRRV